jgi:hypothetical protein
MIEIPQTQYWLQNWTTKQLCHLKHLKWKKLKNLPKWGFVRILIIYMLNGFLSFFISNNNLFLNANANNKKMNKS